MSPPLFPAELSRCGEQLRPRRACDSNAIAARPTAFGRRLRPWQPSSRTQCSSRLGLPSPQFRISCPARPIPLFRGPTRAPRARPRPPANGIDGTSLLLQRHRWNIAVAGRGRRGGPGPPGARLAGRVRLTGHTGPGTAGADTAPGYRRDSLLTKGSCQGKPNLPRHYVRCLVRLIGVDRVADRVPDRPHSPDPPR